MAKNTGRESDQFNLRFPDGMRDRLKEEAARNNRSMNAEIISRLDASLAVNKLSPSDFLGLMDIQNENAEKLAKLLRKIADSVATLGSGAIEMLPDDVDPKD